MLTVGSLFSGCEGTSLGLSAAGIEHRHLWVCDNNKAAAKVLATRFPEVRNLGDVSKVDWTTVARPELLTGGFPCQDVSLAGRRAGLSADTRSGLWLVMAEAIRVLRPRWVLIENTRGLLSARAHSDVEPCPWCLGDDPDQPALRALGAVLGDLSELGYDARWVTVPASDAGAAHERMRVFVLAADTSDPALIGHGDPWAPLLSRVSPAPVAGGAGPDGSGGAVPLLKTPTSQLGVNGGSQHPDKRKAGGHGPTLADEIEWLLPTAVAHDDGKTPEAHLAMKARMPGGTRTQITSLAVLARADFEQPLQPVAADHRFGKYGPAVDHWAQVIGRPWPEPTEAGKTGRRLSPRFVEWFVGLPEGWVTDLVSKNDAFLLTGNVIVPQQLAYALRLMAAQT